MDGKWWILLLLLLMGYGSMGQSFQYSYTDPCTGVLNTVTISQPNGSVTLFYAGQWNTFTQQQLLGGAYEQWVAQINLQFPPGSNPCAGNGSQNATTTNTATATTLVNNVSGIVGIATSIGSQAAGSVNVPPPTNTTSSNGSSSSSGNSSNDNSSNGSSGSGSGSTSTSGGSSSTGGGTGSGGSTGGSGSTGGNGSTGGSGGTGGGGSTGSNGGGSGSSGGGNGGGTPSGGSGGGQPSSGQGEGGGGTSPTSGGGATEGGGTSEGAVGGQENTPTASGGESESSSNGGSGSGSKGGGKSGGGGQKQKSRQEKVGRGALIGSGDFVVIRNGNDITKGGGDNFRFNTSLTHVNTKQNFIKGVNFNYTTGENVLNATFYGSYKKEGFMGVFSNSTMTNFKSDIFNTTTVLAAQKLGFVTGMGGTNFTAGKIGESNFANWSIVAGGFTNFKGGNLLSSNVMLLGVYSPYIFYYQGQWYKSGILLVPLMNVDMKLTNKFKWSISFSGAYQYGQDILNFQLSTGTKMLL